MDQSSRHSHISHDCCFRFAHGQVSTFTTVTSTRMHSCRITRFHLHMIFFLSRIVRLGVKHILFNSWTLKFLVPRRVRLFDTREISTTSAWSLASWTRCRSCDWRGKGGRWWPRWRPPRAMSRPRSCTSSCAFPSPPFVLLRVVHRVQWGESALAFFFLVHTRGQTVRRWPFSHERFNKSARCRRVTRHDYVTRVKSLVTSL